MKHPEKYCNKNKQLSILLQVFAICLYRYDIESNSDRNNTCTTTLFHNGNRQTGFQCTAKETGNTALDRSLFL
jgi:hypothetical protein